MDLRHDMMALASAQRHVTNCAGCCVGPEPVWTRAEVLDRTCIRNLEMKTMLFVTAQIIRLDIVFDLRPFFSLTGLKFMKVVL